MTQTPVAELKIRKTRIEVMRPTQCTVGFLEVELKMQELRARTPDQVSRYLEAHPIPAVRGPDERMYLTDHHHMGLALIRLAQEWDAADHPAAANPYNVCDFQIVKDYSDRLDMRMSAFFARLEAHHLSHPYDEHGQRAGTIPKYLTELVDDPYRSLAGLARKAGAYDKVTVPYTEFIWADYFRDKIDVQRIRLETLADAIHAAVVLARAPAAAGLPGYRGESAGHPLPTRTDIQNRLTHRYGADDSAQDLPPVR